MKRITIDPITRLEGHGKIEIFLDDDGRVANAYFQVPELRGFEKFAEGRPAEEMPQITSRICGICPDAHLMASAKACDDLYKIKLTNTARKLRELQYMSFFVGDHATHFYALAGPDFILGPGAAREERNIIGLIRKLGDDAGQKIISARKMCHRISAILGGRPIHAASAIPGGMTKGLNKEEQKEIVSISKNLLDFAIYSLKIFDDHVLKNNQNIKLLRSNAYSFDTYYMGTVDDDLNLNLYDGKLRIVDPSGNEFALFDPREYMDHIEERVERWTYLKFAYLKKIGWQGLTTGANSGVYQANPLARLNAAKGIATPEASREYARFFGELGGKPVHNNLAAHWARLIEMMYAAERLHELAIDPDLTGPDHQTLPTQTPDVGIGCVEAPRGTLIHHYWTDERGILKKANLIIGTLNNHAAICISIKNAAIAALNEQVQITDEMLNLIEMAFRSYDPCYACATHALPGKMPMEVSIRDAKGTIIASRIR